MIDPAVLMDYWLGVLDGPAEEALEEHLFSCDACPARLAEMIALAEGIRTLAREASLRMIVSDVYLQRAAADGRRVRQYPAQPGGSVACTVTPEDDLLIGRLAANLKGVSRLDLSICDKAGVELQRLADIPVDAQAGSVIFQESITAAKAAPSFTTVFRLLSLDEAGRESLIGEYTFNHTAMS
jgi:hypothetical protein